MDNGTTFIIDFGVPMITDGLVGSNVKPGYFTTSIPDCGTATWLSSSRIRFTINKEMPPLQILRIETPDKLKGLNGELIPGQLAFFPTQKSSIMCTGTGDNGLCFVRAAQPSYKEQLLHLLAGLCYANGSDRLPLRYRPATVKDALADWDALDEVFNYNLNQHDKDELSTHPEDEVIPDTWVIESPGIPVNGSPIAVILPNSRWKNEQNKYGDDHFWSIAAPATSYILSNSGKEKGLYEVQLTLDMPSSAPDAESLIRSLTWTMREDAHSNEWKALEWKNGTLRGKIRGKDITITPLSTESKTIRLLNNEERQGIASLTLRAETGGREISLRCEGTYPTISQPRHRYNSEPLSDVTVLRPREPYIYTDINANHMQLRGSTTLHCRYGQLQSGTARVWKLNSSSGDAVRLMKDYAVLYSGQEFNNWQEEEISCELRKKAKLDEDKIESHKVDTSKLTGVQSMAERALQGGANNELNLPLAELFPNQPVGGFYFVEIEGTPLRESKTPVINQGLVQITDLGLLWKTNGKKILAWGYRLSTAEELPQATLRLLDENGTQLAELNVRNGLAEGDFPVGTRYLQLLTEDDCVTMHHHMGNFDYNTHCGESWMVRKMLKAGISPEDVATPLVYLFSDRKLYRPGETAHIKGIARWVKNNELLTPDIESITARINLNYEEIGTVPVTLEQDGTFSFDVPFNSVGSHNIIVNITYKGDADKTSPDWAALKGHDEIIEYEEPTRSAYINISCKEFRRNEFEVKSELNISQESNSLQLSATATNFTTTPVTNGRVEWNITTNADNFYPSQPKWENFRFGDFRESPWDYFYARYYGEGRATEHDYFARSGMLDADGKGSATFTLPAMEFPRLRRITASTIVTNGNEQSICSVQKATLHPADVYVGIRAYDNMARVGSTLPVELVAVKPDGNAWDGAPIEATVEVKHSVFRPYRYGSLLRNSVRNSEETALNHSLPVTLTGTPSRIEIPVGKAGHYDIIVSGRDAAGRKFSSATRHYVWGDDISPWEQLSYDGVGIVTDKPLYRPGDTAHVLVQTPVDAELLITIERGSILRYYRRKVTVDNPVVEIPIEATDAPVVYLGISLVQNDTRRGSSGKPRELLNVYPIYVEATEKQLHISLEAPQQSITPDTPCTVSGVITDANGQPVSNADVTLYAEDEGTLQVMGYKLPNPARHFYSEIGRQHFVGTHSALHHLLSENLRQRDYGNKGVFIGGGDDFEEEAEEESVSDSDKIHLRKDFNPCALWLSSIRTDAQGRFSTTYHNPDTLTRYRLMAVASAGDKFGAAQSQYIVNKPIMLEPAAPLSATEGDELLVPVTVSMLPEAIPGGRASIKWQVNMTANNAELTAPSQTITLNSNSPVTIHFPIKVKEAGPVELQWNIQAADAPPDSPLSKLKDAVQLRFNAVPPTPHLRESIWQELKSGQSGQLSNWLRNSYRTGTPTELTFSTSPLGGLGQQLKYLYTYPYGCTEQLCSTVLPWILREDLQKTLGLQFPTEKNPAAIIAEVKSRLLRRKLRDGEYGYWDGDKTPCSFSAYAVLIMHLMGEDTLKARMFLRSQLLEGAGERYLNLMVLALCNDLKNNDLESVINRATSERRALSPQENWVLAFCAASINHPLTQQLYQAALDDKRTVAWEDYHLPPLVALKNLFAVSNAPSAPSTAAELRSYLQRSMNLHSTWRNAWMLLTIHRYTQQEALGERRAKVNDTTILSTKPMEVKTHIGDTTTYKAIGNPVYITGYAEGYLTTAQNKEVVNKGFRVQRRYEQLQPDGSWRPTATFKVGDIVRVTISAQAEDGNRNLRYLVLEDRLPASFEAVDPELSSQALAEGISQQEARLWFNMPGYITNREFLKDRVRLFADYCSKVEASYIARVVRSGSVTAPAAKAELMYSPEIYGLSIPQHFDVSPR